MTSEHTEDFSSKNSHGISLARAVQIIFFVLILCAVVFGGVWGYKIVYDVNELRNDMSDAHDSFVRFDFTSTLETLHAARDTQGALEKKLAPVYFFDFIPGTSAFFDSLHKLSRISFVMIRSGIHIAENAQKIVDPIKKSGASRFQVAPEDARFESLKIFAEKLPELAGAKSEMELALADLQSIPPQNLFGPFGALQKNLREKQNTIESIFSEWLPFFQIFPQLAGYPNTKTYLFLLQNNTEVRGTGGFIGTYGILKIKNGIIESFRTDNVYNLDDHAPASLKVDAPEPLRIYTQKKDRKWFFRDSNWSPDFPTSARQALWFYEQEKGGETFDGVFALTPDVLISLLRLLGPISVGGTEFSSENFLSQLQYETEKGFYQKDIPERQRKEIIGTLSQELLNRFSQLPSEKIKDVYGVVQSMLDEKNILLYFTQPSFQSFIHDTPWAGEVHKKQGDYLMVVDSNIVSLKTDKVMEKKIHYSMSEKKEGTLVAHVELTYSHKGEYAWDTSKYKDFVRLLIPEGSTILDTKGAMISESSPDSGTLEISHEYGKMVVGAFLAVEPKATRTFMLEYQLPPKIFQDVQNGAYTFFMQKQSGVSQQYYDGDFSFLRKLKSVEAENMIKYNDGTGVHQSAQLKKDQELTIKF